VIEAVCLSNGNDIFAFDMGSSVKIDHLARRMIELSGYIPDKEIKIVYTGLRPGEKLYEEVLSDEENTLPTQHERIRIAKVRDYSFAQALEYVNRLEELASQVDIPALVRLMKEIVPEYVSNNSDFEIYDKKN
jgi:FlaA1/EpsC-like NDP-sugar epimerase